jgi:co-chaperonin GroES (HSP10)
MVSPTKILIKVKKRFQDEVDFNGGKMYIDPSYRPEWNAFPYGEVHSVPLRNPFISDDFHCNVQVGDRLYVNYVVLTDDSNHVDGDIWCVDYYMALAAVRGDKVIPVGEHILIEPIVEEKKSTIEIPEMSKKIVVNRGKVFSSNDPEIPNGSTVSFEHVGMFENEIEGKKLFVMYNSNILCIHE